jgi:hypothetical protein
MARISRSRGSSFIRFAKPLPTPPSTSPDGTVTPSRKSSDVSAAWWPIFSRFRPRVKPGSVQSTVKSVMPLPPAAGSVLAAMTTRSQCWPLVMKVLAPSRTYVSPFDLGLHLHGLEVGARAGLGHGDGAHGLARDHLRQPALLLRRGAEVQHVRRHDVAVHRDVRRQRAEPEADDSSQVLAGSGQHESGLFQAALAPRLESRGSIPRPDRRGSPAPNGPGLGSSKQENG